MSTTDDFPKTRITPQHTQHASAQRTVAIDWHDPSPPRGETYSRLLHVAIIESYQRDGGAWSRPAFRLQGELHSFTRAEWERLKRETDEAFDTFERTWPLAEDEAADREARHRAGIQNVAHRARLRWGRPMKGVQENDPDTGRPVDGDPIYVEATSRTVQIILHADSRELARTRMTPDRTRSFARMLLDAADRAAQYDANARASEVVRTLVAVIEAVDELEDARPELEAAKKWCEEAAGGAQQVKP